MKLFPASSRKISKKFAGFASVYFLNYFLLGATSLAMSRWLGPDEKGEFTRYMFLIWAFQIFTEFGHNSAVVFLTAKDPENIENLQSKLLRVYLRNTLVTMLISAVPLLIFNLVSPLILFQLWICHLIVVVTTVSLPIIQALNIKYWVLLGLMQAITFVVLAVIFNYLGLSAILAVLAVNLAFVPQGITAHILIKKRIRVHTDTPKFPSEVWGQLPGLARESFIWTLSSTLVQKSDLLVIALCFDNTNLGNYAAAAGWMLLVSPVYNSYSTYMYTKLSGNFSVTRADFRSSLLTLMVLGGVFTLLLVVVAHIWIILILGESYLGVIDLLIPSALILQGKMLINTLSNVSKAKGRPLESVKWHAVLIFSLSSIPIFQLFDIQFTIVTALYLIGSTNLILVFLQYINLMKEDAKS